MLFCSCLWRDYWSSWLTKRPSGLALPLGARQLLLIREEMWLPPPAGPQLTALCRISPTQTFECPACDYPLTSLYHPLPQTPGPASRKRTVHILKPRAEEIIPLNASHTILFHFHPRKASFSPQSQLPADLRAGDGPGLCTLI